jgi:archaellum component FlaC
LKDGYHSELERKDEDLNKARLDYEGRLVFLIGELKAKEAAIQQLKNDKTAMQAKDEKARQTQLAHVERLMKEIEDIFPDMKELKTRKAIMSHSAIKTRNQQLDKIDRLMQEIEEVLPK